MKIIDTAKAMPPSGRFVLAWLEGSKIPMRALWADKFSLGVSAEQDPEWGEYCEEKDEYFCPAGWYEMNQHEESHWRVDGSVVAWCELPSLVAGAAPADGAPRARDLLGIVRTAQAEARRLINGEDSGSDLAQTKLDLPETLRVLEHALSQPAAVAGPALGTKFFSASNEGLDEHDTAEAAQNEAQSIIDMHREEAADGWPEEVDSVCWGVILGKAVERPVKDAPFMAGILGSDMEPVDYVLEPVAAPALEAPAAPDSDLALIVAALEHGQPQMAHYAEPRERHALALAAARRMAAAPQAPAAPSVNERAAYIEFLTGKFPRSYGKEEAGRWWDQGHVSALTWQAARAVAAAPAAPAVDARTLRDAEHYRFIKRHRLILSGGTETFGWPIAPFGDECDRYIAQQLAAERAAQAAAKGA